MARPFTHVLKSHCCLPAVVGSVWRRAGQLAASTRGRQASSTEKDIEEALAPPTPLQRLGKKTKSTVKKLQVCCMMESEWRVAAVLNALQGSQLGQCALANCGCRAAMLHEELQPGLQSFGPPEMLNLPEQCSCSSSILMLSS